jgi:hypothetical protein
LAGNDHLYNKGDFMDFRLVLEVVQGVQKNYIFVSTKFRLVPPVTQIFGGQLNFLPSCVAFIFGHSVYLVWKSIFWRFSRTRKLKFKMLWFNLTPYSFLNSVGAFLHS